MKNKFLLILSVVFIIASCGSNKIKNNIIIENELSLKPTIKTGLTQDFIKKSFVDKENISLKEGQEILYLYKIKDDGNVSNRKVTGRYSLKDNFLVYTPMFDFGYDLEFEIQTNIDSCIEKLRFITPKIVIPNEKTKVLSCYPLQDSIPYNILFFQFLFSGDMTQSKEVNYSIKIYEGDKEIMWNEKRMKWLSSRHFAVIIHPTGLILGGHNPDNKIRPAFFTGKEYSIVITDSLYDKYGRKLINEYKKTFIATAIDMESPVLLSQSKAKLETKEPIIFTFSETMDYGSLILGIKILDVQGKKVKGTIKPTNKGTVWHFIPENKWIKDNYKTILDENIIDLANNRLRSLTNL